jgi:hypothetical protein
MPVVSSATDVNHAAAATPAVAIRFVGLLIGQDDGIEWRRPRAQQR